MAITVDQVVVALEARLGLYEANLRRAQTEFDRRMAAIERRAVRGQQTVNRTMGGFLRAGIFLYAAREIQQYADAWQLVGRSLNATEQFFGVRTRSAEQLVQIAIRTRTELGAVAALYNRTAVATRGLGLAEQDVANVTETVAKALKLGGATSTEAASTLLQLSQAFQKGKLDGDEFRTVMENATVIQNALIKRLGITKAQLYDMAQAGKIGVGDLIDALRDIKPEVDKAFDSSETTIGEAFTNLGTRITEAIGHFSEMSGAAQDVAAVVNAIGDALDYGNKPGGPLYQTAKEWEAISGFVKDVYAFVSNGTPPGLRPRELTQGQFDSAFGPNVKPLQGKQALIDALKFNQGGGAITGGAGPGKAGGNKKTPEEQFADDLRRSREKIQSLRLERETLGQSTFEIERRKVALDLVQEAEKAGLTVTPKLRTEIEGLAIQTANHTASLEREAEALQRRNDAAQEAYDAAREGLRDLITGAKSFDQVLADLLGRLGELALNSAFQRLFAPNVRGPGSGGTLGGIFDFVGSLFAGGFAGGGNIPSGKVGLTGELGPEFIKGPATVTPMGQGESRQGVSIYQSFDLRGVPAEAVGALIREMQNMRQEIVAASVAATQATAHKQPSFFGRPS